MIGTAEQDEFIRNHKYAVVTTLRKDGSPSSSVVFCVAEGDDVIFSTTADRFKAKTVERDGRVAITLLEEGPPYRFLTVEGEAQIQREDIVPAHILIVKAMRGPDFEPPTDYVERLASEGRVIIRLSPERVSGVLNR